MNENSAISSPRSEILRLLVPLAALAAMASFAGREVDPSGAAESAYLAVLAAAVLIPVGFLASWPAAELGLGSALATAAVWILPAGPGRGAAVVLVLMATLAVAAGRRLLRAGPGWLDTLAILIPLTLGLQGLLRDELLFDPSLAPRTLVALIALPVASAVAVSLLSRRHGLPFALIAGGAAVVLAPGFNVASTLALIALVAGDFLAREDLGWPAKAAAWVVLLAPIAWEPGPGVAAAVCGLALWRPRIALALAVAATAAIGWYFQESWDGMLRQLVWLPLLLPAALAPERGRISNILTAALITAAVPQIPDLSALAAPLALAALSMRRDPALSVPQRVWTGTALAGTALMASYPWLRDEPLGAALSLLGQAPSPALAVWVAALFLGIAGLGVWMGRGWGEPLRSLRLAGLAGACVALALLLGAPPPGTALLPPESPVVLDAQHPMWQSAIQGKQGQPVRSVVVESNLSNGAGLAPGTPVAVVHLRDLAGRSFGWTLRAGEDTGEWAARRPDVARTGAQAPPAWVSWVAGDFFAQRYRSRWKLDGADRFVQVRIERAPGAPPDLALALYQLEVRR